MISSVAEWHSDEMSETDNDDRAEAVYFELWYISYMADNLQSVVCDNRLTVLLPLLCVIILIIILRHCCYNRSNCDHYLIIYYQGGRTPLHLAAFNGHPDVITLLLERGAEIGAKNKVSHIVYSML